jgi:hypothetical protein
MVIPDSRAVATPFGVRGLVATENTQTTIVTTATMRTRRCPPVAGSHLITFLDRCRSGHGVKRICIRLAFEEETTRSIVARDMIVDGIRRRSKKT